MIAGQVWLRDGVYRKIVQINNGCVSYLHKSDKNMEYWPQIRYTSDIIFSIWTKEAEEQHGN